jgi:hypothetical protein
MNRKNYALAVLLFLAFFNNLFSQEVTSTQTAPPKEFTISKAQGLTDFIVVTCEGKTKEELYKKAIEWINKNYNKPSEVIKAQVENDYIRFQGISAEEIYCSNNIVKVCSNIKYDIEISFKDGKYKFAVLGLENNGKDLRGIPHWSELNFINSWTHFKKDGEVRKMYQDAINNISGYFNNLSKSLYDYVYNLNETAKKDNW